MHVALSHFAANVVGIVDAPPYVPVQSVDVGSFMQFFTVVRSVSIVVQVDVSHLAANVVGIVEAPPYVPVQAAEVGSVIQAAIGVQVAPSHFP